MSSTVRQSLVQPCRAQQQQQQRQGQKRCPQPVARYQVPLRRQLLAGLAATAANVALRPAAAVAAGIESIDLPQLPITNGVAQTKSRNQAVLDDAERAFQESDLLRTLKERSEANRSAHKKELEDRYCMRQAELGVGDCGGLRLIPGATKSGVQKRPEWMSNLFGLEQ